MSIKKLFLSFEHLHIYNISKIYEIEYFFVSSTGTCLGIYDEDTAKTEVII